VKAIQFTGSNARQVARHLQRDCWCMCSGALAVSIQPRTTVDTLEIKVVEIGQWIANTEDESYVIIAAERF